MSKDERVTKVCCIIIAITVIVTVLFMNGEILGIAKATHDMPYEYKLFDTGTVHSIDIVADEDDWQQMLDNATKEEYINCSIIIDGEKYKNVAIRTKGNSSLAQVASSDSDRYSFKVEFDHYDKNTTYYGLDKLCLNNMVQDNTYLKDYISYDMLRKAGADSPLASFVWITVNNEDWGLYLAVEGIEEGFAQRNYGSDYGNIYKPDSMDMNAGGGDRNRMEPNRMPGNQNGERPQMSNWGMPPQMPGNQNGGTPQIPGNQNGGEPRLPENGDMPQLPENSAMPWMPGNKERGFPIMPDGMDGTMPDLPQRQDNADSKGEKGGNKESQDFSNWRNFAGNDGAKIFGRGMMPGMGGDRGADDVRLVYTDDNYSSYSNIFDNAVFDISDSDKDRLIASLKQLNEQTDLEDVLDIDEVISYFTAHNFVLNGDSYTGTMVHNYYLREHEGKLSMIPWDYNLAFGGMTGGRNDATSLVNSPIDSPASGDMSNLPMISWIFSSSEYTQKYHESFDKFISSYFESGYFEEMIDKTIELINPYVEKDPTAFCTYDEFVTASSQLKQFCLLRAQSIRKQLNGEIPSTIEGQENDPTSFIDASSIDISSMGSNFFDMVRDKRPDRN